MPLIDGIPCGSRAGSKGSEIPTCLQLHSSIRMLQLGRYEQRFKYRFISSSKRSLSNVFSFRNWFETNPEIYRKFWFKTAFEHHATFLWSERTLCCQFVGPIKFRKLDFHWMLKFEIVRNRSFPFPWSCPLFANQSIFFVREMLFSRGAPFARKHRSKHRSKRCTNSDQTFQSLDSKPHPNF